jgi:hypothetical protein
MPNYALTSAVALIFILATPPAFAAKTSIKCDDGKTVTISTTGGNCTSGTYGSCTTTGEKDFTSGGCLGGKAHCGASGGTGECTISIKSPGGGGKPPKVTPPRVPNAGVKAQ